MALPFCDGLPASVVTVPGTHALADGDALGDGLLDGDADGAADADALADADGNGGVALGDGLFDCDAGGAANADALADSDGDGGCVALGDGDCDRVADSDGDGGSVALRDGDCDRVAERERDRDGDGRDALRDRVLVADRVTVAASDCDGDDDWLRALPEHITRSANARKMQCLLRMPTGVCRRAFCARMHTKV